MVVGKRWMWLSSSGIALGVSGVSLRGNNARALEANTVAEGCGLDMAKKKKTRDAECVRA